MGQTGRAKSYAERLFEFVSIDRLDTGAAKAALCVPGTATPLNPSEPDKAPHLPWDFLEKSARTYFRASALQRILIIKQRVPARYVQTITVSMKMPKETLYGALNLARATIDRKVLKKELLNQDESERILAITRLVGQADSIVRDSGTPEGFSAAEWLPPGCDIPIPRWVEDGPEN